MKRRKPFLKSLLAKFRKTEVASAPVVPTRRPLVRKVTSSIEGLEGRIAPATLLNPSTVIFQDLEGDTVTVKFSKNLFTGTTAQQLATANQVFKFSAGDIAQSNTTPQQLQLIDFTKFAVNLGTGLSTATGVSVTVTAVKTGLNGNAHTDVGAVNATNIALGAVTIDGDLGRIDAGRASAKTGLSSLTVESFGIRGTATQLASPAPDLLSNIIGAVGSVKVNGDFQDARFSVANGSQGNPGNVGSITILGSLKGRAAVEAASNTTGLIDVAGNIGAVKIGTDSTEGIIGGGGASSGEIFAGGKIASLTISGNLTGGAGNSSGIVVTGSDIGAIKIGTALSNGIFGGAGTNSGQINASGKIASLTVSGDVAGGTGEWSGTVVTTSKLGAVKLGGDLAGGNGANSGRIQGGVSVSSVLIEGNLVAGAGSESGQLVSQNMGAVTVDVIDGRTASAGSTSGGIFAGKLTSLTLKDSLFGGTGNQAGFVQVFGDIGTIKIAGNIVGGTGVSSGSIIAHGRLASLTVNGNILGGDGLQSGLVKSGFDTNLFGDMGAVKVLGRIEGGVGDQSGAIQSGGKLTSLTVGSNATLVLQVLKGGAGDYSGVVSSEGSMGAVRISGHLAGGGGDYSGMVQSKDRIENNGDFAGDMSGVTITGQIRGGDGVGSGGLRVDGNLASLTVGSWIGGTGAGSGSVHTGEGFVRPGNSGAIKVLGTFLTNGTPGAGSASVVIGGNLSSFAVTGLVDGATVRAGDAIASLTFGADVTDVTVTARGQAVQGKTTDVAIGRIDVKGSVANSLFLAGYNLQGLGVNPDAQIGTVTVKSNWTASSLAAGVGNLGADGLVGGTGADADNVNFGDTHDVKIALGTDSATIISKIASVQIGGAVDGTAVVANATDHFGFVAEQIAKLKVGTFTFPLTAAATQQRFDQDTAAASGKLGSSGNDVSIHEV
jgi:hypothetical protein